MFIVLFAGLHQSETCHTLNVTENSICCKTPPKPHILKTVYPGGRGLKLEVWNNSRPVHLEEILEYNEKTPGYTGASWVDSASYIWPMEQDTFVARFSGFLVAPDSDVYRFYIRGDDRYAIYFSQTGIPEDKVRIAYHSAYANSYFSSPAQRSDDIHLQKGKEYYIEILLQEYRLSAFVDVGLYQYQNVYTEQQTGDAVNEEQVIKSQSAIIQEVQVITLENWETTKAINEVQKIRVTSPCVEANSCSLYQYRLIYNMEKTGDFDLLGYEVFKGNNVTLDITEQTKGKPNLETFTLNWDGIASTPLTPWSSEAEVSCECFYHAFFLHPLTAFTGHLAVEEMVSTKCPPQITNFEEGFVVKYFRDYETDFNLERINRGQTTAETDAYCGRYSLKNPAVLFDSADVKPNRLPYGDILLFPYNQLCLAYKGFLANYIGLKFQYQDSSKIIRSTDVQFTYNFAYGNKISLQKASESQAFYVDVVYIGHTSTISTLNEMPKRRLPALANKGIFLEHFQVNRTKINGPTMTHQYFVTMTSYNCSYNIPMMAVSFGQIRASQKTFCKIITYETENEVVYRGSNWPGDSKIHIQRIQAASPPLSGSFDIQAYGRILKGLPASVSAADLQFALQSLEGMGRVSVTREGTCAGYTWNIKWRSTCGKQNLLQINDSNIIGEKANMTVTRIKEGGLFRQHILGDLLRTPSQQPQVEVYVNGIPAKCSGDCGFTWDSAITPLVLGTSPSQGSYEEGTILTIVGSGFSPSSAVTVSVGPVGCYLLSVDEKEIKCQILNGSAGHAPVAVSIADVGLAQNVGGEEFYFVYQSQISHIWPDSGSIAGGTLLTLSGFGFNENSKVLVGNGTCNVIEGDLNRITCRTPKKTEGTVDISVTTNGFQATARDAFSYNCLQTPIITDFSPKVRTVLGEVNLTINGYNFGNELTQNVVYVGGKTCEILHWNFTDIRCLLPKLPPGKHDIYVEVRNWGFASTREKLNSSIQYVLEVTSMFPQRGSLFGGTEITIRGFGFSTIPAENAVLLGSIPCNVTSSSENVIKCILHSTGNIFRITNNGKDSAAGLLMRLTPFFSKESLMFYQLKPGTFPCTCLWVALKPHMLMVTIGSYPCVTEESSDDSITCHIDPQNSMDVGIREIVTLTVYNLGTAINTLSNEFDRRFVLLPNIDLVLPNVGSTTGMTRVTIKGSGFAVSSAGVEVLMGHFPCKVLSVNYTTIECETSPAVQQLVDVYLLIHGVPAQCQGNCTFSYLESITPYITGISPNSIIESVKVIIEGEGFGTVLDDIAVFIGNQQFRAIDVNENNITALVTSLPVGRHSLSVVVGSKGLALGNLSVSSPPVASVSPASGSIAGGTTLVITGNGFYPGNTTVTIGDDPCQIISINPKEVYCHTPPRTAGMVGPPGTEIEITGSNFGIEILDISVMINNILCNVTMANDSVLQCIVGDHAGGTFPVMMHHKTKGLAISTNCIQFDPPLTGRGAEQACEVSVANGKDLSQSTTPFTYAVLLTPLITAVSPKRGSTAGGTRLTVMGENIEDVHITIAEAKCAVECSNKTHIICMTDAHPLSGWAPVHVHIRGVGMAKLVIVLLGGTLIFDEADIELQAENILITDGGILQIGTETSPFQHKAIITLHGHLRSPELPVYGAKTLAVREGILDLHGTQIRCKEKKINTTKYNGHTQRENEKRTIASVSADGITITLSNPLNYTHLGITVTLPDGTLFEARAEVGILTRNILIRGSDNVEWNNKIPACPDGFDTGEFATQTCLQGKFGEEIGSDQFGGCIMFHAPVPGANMVTGRIEYVEVFHAGQAFRLGRYPIHWHLLGDLHFKSYVRGCAIHQAYNRAITIHNTHHLLVERNIIYDIRGGAFFIEDGIEHGNILQYNLAVFVQQSTSLLNDDVTPAAFWVTNPNNTIRHNAVAGGTHFGFWYRMNNHPDGPSYDRNICQKRVPLGEFFNNTVHSQGWFGMWIFEEYFPMQMGSCTSTVPVPARFNSFTAWNCQKGAEWVNGGALQFHNFVMVNNYEAGIETKRILAPYVGGWGETNGAMIKNAKIVGRLNDLGMGSAFCTRKGLVLPFSEGLTVSSVHFMNFDHPNCVALGVTSISGVCNDRCGGWSAKFVDIQYFHTPNKAGFRWEHEMVLIDVDGSLTGHKGHTVIPHSSLLDPSHCTQEPEWSIGFPGSVCDASVSFHRLAFNKPSPVSLLEKDVSLSSEYLEGKIYKLIFLIPQDSTQNINIANSTSIIPFQKKRLTHMSGWMALIPNANHINWYFKVSGRNDLQQSQPISANLDPDVKDVVINFQAYCCILQDCFPVHPPSRKPMPKKRPATYKYIGFCRIWIVADIDIPSMERLIIWGVLELEDKYNLGAAESSYREVVLNATYISLQGGRLIGGWEDNPFKGDLKIVLRGNHTTRDWALPEGPNQGSKVLGVFGELDLHGIPRSIYKTKLSETADAGSKILSLMDAVDWQVKEIITDFNEGEEIVITTTSYDFHQTETRSIVKILHDRKILILNDSLSYTHFAEKYHVPGTGESYTLAADVGILSRNIKIVGEDYPGWSQDSFGAHILVGSFTENMMTFKGNARISNVEFYHSGQEGFRDSTDPRYAVTFLNLGQIQEHGLSYIQGCAFHHGFSPAIGVFGTDGLDIDDNIIHFTVGEGIRIWGNANRVRGNLIALSVWPGTYQNRKDLSSTLWHAAIEINGGTNTVLQNNVVAGFARAGYRIDGEPCPSQFNPVEKWFDNEAHGGLYGIYMNQDGLPGCSLIQGFTIWTCWDYGIYFQTTENVYIYNVTLVDNGMAIFPMIYLPAAISHKISNKKVQIKSSLIVGSSPGFNCSDILTNDDPNVELTAAHRSPRSPSGEKFGTLIINEVNPSDCVDMVCDAKRKSFLRDIDGSFLGNAGFVIPQAEYEWDGNSQLGIGDYRIPKNYLAINVFSSLIPLIVKTNLVKLQSQVSSILVLGGCSREGSIVALNKSYEIYFTGTSPQNLRLMLLNVDHNKAVLVGIFFSTLQRLDVYVNNTLVCPKNTIWNAQQKHCELNTLLYKDQILPNLDSTVLGENYFDRTYQLLYLLVKGTIPVEIHTATVIFVSFQLPAVTEDDFYTSHNLVRNLALFLKIPSDKIRISKMIREKSLRRKRSMGFIIEIEIGNPPIQFLNNGTTARYTSPQTWAAFLKKAVTAQPVERSAFPVHHVAFVSSLSVITQPVAAQPGKPFPQQPSVKATDSDGNCVSVGITALTLRAILKDSSNNQVSGLSGNTTIPFSSCWANYTDLTPLRTAFAQSWALGRGPKKQVLLLQKENLPSFPTVQLMGRLNSSNSETLSTLACT
ncbi:Fibrocystin-L [Saguinus oedipus]|uniref:Fibrocystin-L n=1 Tax=Saguinus oedipus TaxID=9490 RepID=A0ABQ9UE85_SAGOE|nr:Fibrocystin-L [Saguinus oedipus]